MITPTKATLIYSPIAILSMLVIWFDHAILGLISGTLALPVYVMAAVGGIAKKVSPYIFLEMPTPANTRKYVSPRIVTLAMACFILYLAQIVLLALSFAWNDPQKSNTGNVLIVAIASAVLAQAICVAKGISLKR